MIHGFSCHLHSTTVTVTTLPSFITLFKGRISLPFEPRPRCLSTLSILSFLPSFLPSFRSQQRARIDLYREKIGKKERREKRRDERETWSICPRCAQQQTNKQTDNVNRKERKLIADIGERRGEPFFLLLPPPPTLSPFLPFYFHSNTRLFFRSIVRLLLLLHPSTFNSTVTRLAVTT